MGVLLPVLFICFPHLVFPLSNLHVSLQSVFFFVFQLAKQLKIMIKNLFYEKIVFSQQHHTRPIKTSDK